MSRRSTTFNPSAIGQDPVQNETEYHSSVTNSQPLSLPISEQLKLEGLKNKRAIRGLRIGYAIIAVCFAIASIVFWMRFVQFYYSPQKHSDTFFATLTTACTINILAAFISIIKGLFPNKKS